MMSLILSLLLAANSPAEASPCSPIPGVDAVLGKSDVRWIIAGEIHGTSEMPSAFEDLLCAAAKGPRKIIVALEHPVSEQQIDEYLASNGDAAARAKLLSASIWQWKVTDGRTSEAFLSLIEHLRVMKSAGQIRGVVTFQPSGTPLSAADYEKEMARVVEGASASPDVLVVALVGNIHARTTEWAKSNGETYMPMAGLLPRPQTVTLFLSGNGGTAWTCPWPTTADSHAIPECGARPTGVAHKIYPRGIVPIQDQSAPYSAYFNIGTTLSSSPPALH